MQLTTAFSIRAKDVVAFVGGGGKTTAMFRLAAELAAQGKRVVTTTTTRIFAAQIQLAPAHLYATDSQKTLHNLQYAIHNSPHVLVIGATKAEGKAFGVEPALADQISALDEIDAVLVEADGSRMRSLKAPAAHEPVIPDSTTLLVPVVGIDILGKPLNDEHVHRADLVAQVADVPPGVLIDVELVARVIASPQGGLKGKPPRARVIPLLNRIEDEVQLGPARALAKRLLRTDAIEAVAIGAVKNAATPIREVQQRVAAVVLAAGGSTRMQGTVKQLLPWGDVTLVRHAVNVASQADVSDIVVVVGARADKVAAQLEGTNARVVVNPAWASGRASSVRAGIRALDEKMAAAIFINSDQPFLNAAVIDQVIGTFAVTRAPIVVPTYDGNVGSPVLFARELFAELIALEGEQGGRALLQKQRARMERVEIQDTRAATDVDTPEEYRAAVRQAQTQ